MRFFFPFAVLATAIPYGDPHAQSRMGSNADSGVSWNLAKGPGINSTSNLVFETVNSLLQHWPNTRYRNGKFNFVAVMRVLPKSFPKLFKVIHWLWQRSREERYFIMLVPQNPSYPKVRNGPL